MFTFAFLIALVIQLGDSPSRNKQVWLTDYRAARRLARESAKPIFVVFRCEH